MHEAQEASRVEADQRSGGKSPSLARFFIIKTPAEIAECVAPFHLESDQAPP